MVSRGWQTITTGGKAYADKMERINKHKNHMQATVGMQINKVKIAVAPAVDFQCVIATKGKAQR